jgi:hypothetical protein
MTNIAQEVRDFLNRNPHIVKGLQQRIVNIRGLSLYILRELEEDVSVQAIMTAVRRYQKEITSKKKRKDVLKEIYHESKVSTKSRLLIIEVKRHLKILRNYISEILDNTHVSKGEVLRIIEGRQSLKFVIDHSKKKEILKLIPKDEIITITENLGEISVGLPDKYKDMAGIYAPLLNELAISDINIIVTTGGLPEIIIVIKEEDISRCHDILLRFCYGK